jgi:hypothetical protein
LACHALRHGRTPPPDLGWTLFAGIGFRSLVDSAKLGIFLASVVPAVAGLTLLIGVFASNSPAEFLRPN